MMSAHYYFYNKTKEQFNVANIPPKNKTFISKLNNCEPDNVIEIFKFIISQNRWNGNDKIIAETIGEDYPIIVYAEKRLKYKYK